MKFRRRDYLLAPIYLYQAYQVKRRAISLPEPSGDRHGCTKNGTDCLRLMVLGDSAGAGVGVDTQDSSALGRIIHHLSEELPNTAIDWQLHATTGHTSHQLLERLQHLAQSPATQPIDYAVVSIGVNDVVKKSTDCDWCANIRAISQLLSHDFCAKQVLFLSLPPMQLMPSLPAPLNQFLGYQAARLDKLMSQVCQETAHACHLPNEFSALGLTQSDMFARDGFHPSAVTYDIWAQTLARHIAKHWLASAGSQIKTPLQHG